MPCVVLDVPPLCGDIHQSPLDRMRREESSYRQFNPTGFEVDSLPLRDMSPTSVVGSLLYDQQSLHGSTKLRRTLPRTHMTASMSTPAASAMPMDSLVATSHIPLYERVLNPSAFAGTGHLSQHQHSVQIQSESDFL